MNIDELCVSYGRGENMNELKYDEAYRELLKTEDGYEVRRFIIGYKHPLFQEVVNYFYYLSDKKNNKEYKKCE